jgi:hypothetical protein
MASGRPWSMRGLQFGSETLFQLRLSTMTIDAKYRRLAYAPRISANILISMSICLSST